MKVLKSLACMAVVASVLTVGCSTAGIEGRKAANREQIRVNNPWLRPYLELAAMKMTTVGDVLKVNATVFSSYRKDLRLQYKFTWYDKEGMVLEEDVAPWKPITLYGYETKDVVGVAPSPAAKEFKIIFREYKN